jgi:hypothetical protein
MPFFVSRGAQNVTTEVQRWQFFLRRQGVTLVGRVDGDFGGNTEAATRIFQRGQGLPESGALDSATLPVAEALGYTVVPDDHYKRPISWPPKPAGLSSPGNAWRNATFGCFTFVQDPPPRHDKDAIRIGSNCSGAVANWEDANIVSTPNPHLARTGLASNQRLHRLAEKRVLALWKAWEAADLLHLVISYEGDFSARYMRGRSPSYTEGHPERRSDAVAELSNHAFGTAFDICARDNPFTPKDPTPPAAMGRRGCVRELVPIANAHGFYWGGHYKTTPDGMHFELARLDAQ